MKIFGRLEESLPTQALLVADVPGQLASALHDRYGIERELGAGGMATVYLARDLKHHRAVAIKVLRPELVATVGPQRFLQEIQIAARLTHPHILPLIESGDADGFLYYVLPYIRGKSLRQRLDEERQLPIEEALQICGQVAAALDYAHRQGVIHRDIKPENILLHEGEAMVTDFGIALAFREAAGPRLTEAGLSIGTPQYMSPEQALAERTLDARTDVYSLGAVLYEMLVGEPPYTGPSAQAILTKSLNDPLPSARRLRKTISPGVDIAIARALARIPADRFLTAAQFAEALITVPATLTARQSIAVLPFANLSPDVENEYFADGMTDEIINVLTQIGELRVAARTSSFAFKGKALNIRSIAEDLQVGNVLEGSVRKAGNRLRITVQLTNPVDGYHLWSHQYDREIHDVFAIQDEIARGIAQHLKVTLAGHGGETVLPRPTEDLEAYQLYLKGRYFWARRDGESLPKAIEYFTQALARDPGFAAASAGLADSYLVSGVYGYLPPWEVEEKGRLAAERAIACDDMLSDAHFAVGLYELLSGWHLDVALREFRRAAELAPSSARPPAWFSYVAGVLGQTSEALAAARQAQALEPLSPLIHSVTGQAFLHVHAYDEALVAVQRSLELEPTFFTALWCAGLAYEGQGKHEAAINVFEQAAESSNRSPIILAFLGLSLARAGRSYEARAVAAELERGEVSDPYSGLVHWGLGDGDNAFAQFCRAFERRVPLTWTFGSLAGNENLTSPRKSTTAEK